MTDEDRIGFDEGCILELMKEYREASTRRERRDIETEVLAETVWKAPELEPNELILTRQELEDLLESLTQAVKEGDRLRVEQLHRYPSFLLYEEG
ncbi:hypothetical protein HTZ84_09400 [Haloterrigena sp. SYSU A558-1]|uniref:Uncharacterized protein n=1 Tax=Haloterrigena gelatinilytica TaxID=2741724 RepID=A0A8J8GNJ0_9EURY|nr:hypothetical protein [Haloterrigena gelatinilytica]NUB91687.1 hypothetical protein [Haloterrigena gelatinilytica]NUC72520.1 hypothetical protein [Haloterrigena gelatinilytica]